MPLLPEYLIPKAVHGISIGITDVRGNEYFLETELQNLEIYESMDSHCVYGFLYLYDSTEVKELLPLVGQERLNIKFSKVNTEVDLKNLHITNIEDSVDLAGLTILKMHFTSYQSLANHIKYISRSYDGILSDIIESIYESSFGIKLDVKEKSNGAFRYIAPNIPPFEVVKVLLKECMDGDYSPMFFYKTIMSNKYELRSLASMRSDDSVAEFNDGPAVQFNADPIKSYSDQRNNNKITQFSVDKFSNIFEMIKYGVVASRANHMDLVGKTYNQSRLQYEGKNIDSSFAINEENPFESAAPRPQNTFGNYKSFEGSITNLEGSESFSKLVQKAKFNERGIIAVTADMYSNENLNVGTNIDLSISAKVPKASGSNKELVEYKDMNLSGKYLIHSIKHTIKPDEYTVQCRLLKDYIK